MTYKIWNGQEQLFDIDSYMMYDKALMYYSEITVSPYLKGLFKFVTGNTRFSLDEFIKDTEYINDLRAWLWETHTNDSIIMPEAEKRQTKLMHELKDILNDYCKKYGFQITTD